MSALVQAAAAVGIAGVARVGINSIVSIGYGPRVFGEFATAMSGILLIAGIASAGPSAAVTLGVARRWGETPGQLPRSLAGLLAAITLGFILVLSPAGLAVLPHAQAMPAWLWLLLAGIYCLYRAARALVYAVDLARVATIGEGAAALVTLIGLRILMASGDAVSSTALVLLFVAGSAAFVLLVAVVVRRSIRLVQQPLRPKDRYLALRESVIFTIGAGSSVAVQYLPVVIAGSLQSTTYAALVFGALQATAPLLLLSRVYQTVMLPSFAARPGNTESHDHVAFTTPVMIPSVALALGLTPWLVASLGMPLDATTVDAAALVALSTLLQLWSTPAVTALSAGEREFIPAACSVGGVAAGSVVWWYAVHANRPELLPVGLVVGSAVRSLVPVWVALGGRFRRPSVTMLVRIAQGAAIVLLVGAMSRMRMLPALCLGSLLMAAGLAGCLRAFFVAREAQRARTARQ